MVTGQKQPYENSPVVVFLRKQIDALAGHKSQKQIAQDAGYDKPNIISMFKRGESKIPLQKIPALARALHVDPAFMFRLAFQEYWPDDASAIHEVFGEIVTPNDREWVKLIREILNHEDDPRLTPERADRIRKALGSNK